MRRSVHGDDALSRKTIDRGRFNLRIAITTETIGAKRVDGNEDQVSRSDRDGWLRRRRARQAGKAAIAIEARSRQESSRMMVR